MTDPNPTLAMAEAYYMVSRDLERDACEKQTIAKGLNRIADQLCEKNIADEAERAKQDEVPR